MFLAGPEIKRKLVNSITSLDVHELLSDKDTNHICLTINGLIEFSPTAELQLIENWLSPHLYTFVTNEECGFLISTLFKFGKLVFFRFLILLSLATPNMRSQILDFFLDLNTFEVLSDSHGAAIVKRMFTQGSCSDSEFEKFEGWIYPYLENLLRNFVAFPVILRLFICGKKMILFYKLFLFICSSFGSKR